MFDNKPFSWIVLLTVALILGTLGSSAAADWKPSGPIKMMIAFRAGGGADTQARLIAEELQKRHGWKIIPAQVAGKGGINLAKALAKSPNDGTVIGIAVTETFGYNLVVSKKSGLKLSDFTSLTTTAGFQMGMVALTSKGWKTFYDVITAAKGGQEIRLGAMSQRVADVTYLLGKANGLEFNIVMTKGGKGVMNGINAGDIDAGFVAGPQAKAVIAGDMVNLASGLSKPLKLSPDAPLLKDLGVEFNMDGYFLFVAPAGIPEEARRTINNAIAEIVTDPQTKVGGYINKTMGGPAIVKGAELDRFLREDYEASSKLLKVVSQ